ncbi:MAG: hypothetical protein PF551_01725 [Candidatus Marinimicrobia bacterium]|jgi:hypothetical protein|nr:hypothetical protein [Candidatus Neomarinimicrobiota bacterium]
MKNKGIWLKIFLLFILIFNFAIGGEININVEVDESDAEGQLVNMLITGVDNKTNFKVFKKLGDEPQWIELKSINKLSSKIYIKNDILTSLKVITYDDNEKIIAEAISEQFITKAQWFNTSRLARFIFLLVTAFLILFYIEKAKKKKEIYLRPIAGLQAFEEAVGRATEMGKPVLFVPGIMDLDQVETISGVIILGHVSKMTARYETDLNVPVARSIVMEAGREIVRESYMSEGRPDQFNSDMVHYLTDDQFAYAAGVNGIMLREKPAAVFMQGKFFAESLILAETGNSIGAIQIAGTGSQAQLPFFITACDYTLIGEEFFAASAYLSQDPKLLGSIKGQDMVKAAIMIIIVAGVVFESFGAEFFKKLFEIG